MGDSGGRGRPEFELAKHLKEHELNIRTGWWYMNNILESISNDEIHSALVAERDNKNFSDLIIRQCNKDNKKILHEIKKSWTRTILLSEKRRQVMLDALDAHLQEKYTLSSPALLPQIEYIYKTVFPVATKKASYKNKEPQAFYDEQYEDYRNYFLDERLGEMPGADYVEFFSIYSYFENILFANDKLRKYQKHHDTEMHKISETGNRNKISHGEDEFYATESISLKHVLFVDKLLDVLGKTGLKCV